MYCTNKSFLLSIATVVIIAAVQIAGYAIWGGHHTITQIPTIHKVVALTIDDGPHSVTTPEILAILKEKNVHVTFFILGQNAEKKPELLLREILDGHELGVHAFHHKSLTKIDKAHIIEQMEKTEKLITAVSPVRPVVFRPPGGAYNENVLAAAQEKGYSTILWNIDTLDWTRPSVSSVVNKVIDNVSPGSIILLHDGQYPLPTPKAIAIIIDKLRQQGYEFVTVSELLEVGEARHSLRN